MRGECVPTKSINPQRARRFHLHGKEARPYHPPSSSRWSRCASVSGTRARFQGTVRRVLGVAITFLSVFAGRPSAAPLYPSNGSKEQQDVKGEERRLEKQMQHTDIIRRKAASEGRVTVVNDPGNSGASGNENASEADLIQPIMVPFKQTPEEWEKKGISLSASGEPKSGTTWLARVIVELCLQLCGNPENRWCKMGGLTVLPTFPAPRYDFEMLHADTEELFLHFKGKVKHIIPGLDVEGSCKVGYRPHKNTFGGAYPCHDMRDDSITREELTACLPDDSPECARFLPPLDPSLRRMIVIFRDARNVIISEHRMRIGDFHQEVGELEPFIRRRFKTVVAWLHQRWVWHTTTLKDVSRVVFYEELEAYPHHLVDLADYIGLNCSQKEADDVWRRHTYANPPGDYTTYGLSMETLEWMNASMSALLPEALLAHYGLPPTYP